LKRLESWIGTFTLKDIIQFRDTLGGVEGLFTRSVNFDRTMLRNTIRIHTIFALSTSYDRNSFFRVNRPQGRKIWGRSKRQMCFSFQVTQSATELKTVTCTGFFWRLIWRHKEGFFGVDTWNLHHGDQAKAWTETFGQKKWQFIDPICVPTDALTQMCSFIGS
jgi:hypothetical protein